MPAAADIAVLERCAAEWSRAEGRAPRGLLMGVTPAIACMAWPPGSQLVAVDRAGTMIRDVWPKTRPIASWAVCADWRDMPIGDRSRDVAFNDGGFTLVDFPDGYRRIFAGLRRVMTERGRAAIRFHIKPDRPESPAQVIDELGAGRIGSFHVFKWRLVMAVQADVRTGVRLGDVFEAWRTAVAGSMAGNAARGWPAHALELLAAYRGVDARYHFPTLAELRAETRAQFHETAVFAQDYELGERCPTIVLEPR